MTNPNPGLLTQLLCLEGHNIPLYGYQFTYFQLFKNYKQGIKGKVTDDFDLSKLDKIQTGEGRIGKAEIITCIDGIRRESFSVSIVKAEFSGKEDKNFVIKVTDKRLIDYSGGIVQGMSGSPIVQDGKLVGAVTHVFINDPTRGYGISVDNMLGVADEKALPEAA